MKMLNFLTVALLASSCAHAELTSAPESCTANPELQKKKSLELQTLLRSDQDGRLEINKIDWQQMLARDLERRILVARLFAEGCFKVAADYAAAALIFQHGDSADHFYQAFVWANAAVKLGDKQQLSTVAIAIDRYLVKIGQKQIFGTQFNRKQGGPWCIEPVEKSFSDEKRLMYRKMNLHDEIAFVLLVYKSNQSVGEVQECDHDLKPSPAGTVPGFW